MLISEILEALGDERITTHTPIMCQAGHLNIESVDIMEMIVVYNQSVETTVENILKLMIEGVIVGSTDILMANGEEDPLDTFGDDFTEKFIRITTTL